MPPMETKEESESQIMTTLKFIAALVIAIPLWIILTPIILVLIGVGAYGRPGALPPLY
jgi:hypothetical protein